MGRFSFSRPAVASCVSTITLVSSVVLLAATVTAADPPTYAVTDIGLPPGYVGVAAASLNNAGQVVVIYDASGGDTRSYLWDNGVLTDLGAFGGAPFHRHEAKAINEQGRIVGSSWGYGFPAAAWSWQNGVFTDLGALGGPYANAYGINSSNQITGWAYAPEPAAFFAYIYDDGVMTDLGALPAISRSTGYDINETGQVAASSGYVGASFNRATIASASLGMFDLGTLGGMYVHANSINDAGVIVGYATTGAIGANGWWVGHAFAWSDGVMTDLGTLPGDVRSGAMAINNAGDIVGSSSGEDFSPKHAVLWRAGVAYDLNASVQPPTEWILRIARDVNDVGQIAVIAELGGESHPLLLTPAE